MATIGELHTRLSVLEKKKIALTKELSDTNTAVERLTTKIAHTEIGPWRVLAERLKGVMGKPFVNSGHIAFLLMAYGKEDSEDSWGYTRVKYGINSGTACIFRRYETGWMTCCCVAIENSIITCTSQNREFCPKMDMKAPIGELKVQDVKHVARSLGYCFGPITRDPNGFPGMQQFTPQTAATILEAALDRERTIEECIKSSL